MPLRLPAYQPIPAPDRGTDLIEVSAAQLQPTQWCVGLAEIWSREKDFSQDTRQQRLDYLRGKPVPLIRSANGAMWMLDRHHRLRGLIGIDPGATTWGYVVEELPTSDRNAVLAYLHNQAGSTSTTDEATARARPSSCPRACWDWTTIPTGASCGS